VIELGTLILSTIANFSLALLPLAKNRRSDTNKLFALLALTLASWPIASYGSLHAATGQLAYIRLTIGLVVIMNWSFFALSCTLPKSHMKWTLQRKLELIFSVILAPLVAFTPLAFSSVTITGGAVNPTPAPGIVLFMANLLYFIGGGFIILIRRYRKSRGLERLQLRFVIMGASILYGGSLLTNFVLAVLLHFSRLVFIGPLYTVAFAASIAIAIVKHRMFDLRLVVARSIAYLLLLGTLAIIYGFAWFGLTRFFFKAQMISISQEAVYIVLALVLALTFQPLRKFFEKVTEQVFYREHYDSQAVLNNLTKVLVSELHLNRMLKRSLTVLCEDIHIQFGQIIVFNNDRVYSIEHYGPLPQRLMVAPELRRLESPMLVADELSEGERKRIMEHHGVRLSMTLRSREDFVGFLLLGDKLSGDIYSNQDIELLEIVGKEFAVAIQNAKAYEEIQAFNLTLQARIDHATNRLRVANRHLKDLDRAKDEFISMASHQLRTPLTTVKGYLSMMLEGDVGKMPSNQKEFVQYAFDASERMVNLISDLLNVSRLSAGRFLIQTKPTDMVAMIEDEVRQLQSHAKQKGISLVFEPPKEPLPPAEIDDNKTRQVVMNFIDNAIYYTQQGEVRVVLEQTGDHVRLEVRDTGIGVPEDAKKKLFSKFYRAGNAQTVRPDGTGLGLYLAKRVVEDQDGTIIFNSVEGKGSTFGFELPFKPPKPVKKKHEEKVGHPAAHK
jgi:signal transduction histidine kinase